MSVDSKTSYDDIDFSHLLSAAFLVKQQGIEFQECLLLLFVFFNHLVIGIYGTTFQLYMNLTTS